MLFSLVIFGLCAVFYGAAVVVFALGLYLQGPLGWLMFLVGGWALFNSGVYTLLVETARLDMPPANRKPGKTPVRKTRGRWCDELAPAAWRRLVSARNAAAVWYDITYMPQLHETLRSALEYAMLAVAAVADLAIFCVAYLYVLGGPVLVARKADGILSWVQGAVFLVVGLYFLATWLVRRYPDRKDIANAEALKTAGEAAQEAIQMIQVALAPFSLLRMLVVDQHLIDGRLVVGMGFLQPGNDQHALLRSEDEIDRPGVDDRPEAADVELVVGGGYQGEGDALLLHEPSEFCDAMGCVHRTFSPDFHPSTPF